MASCVRSARRVRAWKVLRVLGSVLGLPGFEFDTAEEVRNAALGTGDLTARLSNKTGVAVAAQDGCRNARRHVRTPRRRADLSCRCAVRRAESLHLTAAARDANVAGLPTSLFDKLGLKNGDAVRVPKATSR